MSVISLSFVIFIMIAAAVYFTVPMKMRPYILLTFSIFFYSTFNITHFVFLGISTVTSFAASHMFSRMKKYAYPIAVCTIILNAGILISVKFLNYSFSVAERIFNISLPEISIISAVGISFYTMQVISYCVDVYKEKYPAEKNFFKYLLYITYFPIIIQGPICRYGQLADQLFEPHRFSFDRMKSGCSLILWGAFKKLVIADRAAILVNEVFGNSGNYDGFEIITAVLFYTLQIYTDFSGFTDISRGISEIFGIELPNNFDHPYFADSIKDFWHRWHISLSTWFRDYIYIPLGGNRKGRLRKYINLFAIFFISGLWHGAGFNYIVWGLLQAVFQIIGELTAKLKNKLYDVCNVNRESFSFALGKRLLTFSLVNFSWLFFRADGTVAALGMLKSAVAGLSLSFFFDGSFLKMGLNGKDMNILFVSVLILLAVSLMQERFSVREKLEQQAFWFRYTVYIAAVVTIICFGVYGPGYEASQFIYMQF